MKPIAITYWYYFNAIFNSIHDEFILWHQRALISLNNPSHTRYTNTNYPLLSLASMYWVINYRVLNLQISVSNNKLTESLVTATATKRTFFSSERTKKAANVYPHYINEVPKSNHTNIRSFNNRDTMAFKKMFLTRHTWTQSKKKKKKLPAQKLNRILTENARQMVVFTELYTN